MLVLWLVFLLEDYLMLLFAASNSFVFVCFQLLMNQLRGDEAMCVRLDSTESRNGEEMVSRNRGDKTDKRYNTAIKTSLEVRLNLSALVSVFIENSFQNVFIENFYELLCVLMYLKTGISLITIIVYYANDS